MHPDFHGGPPAMFVCGNDDEAKKAVIDDILTKFGWETIDTGYGHSEVLLHRLQRSSTLDRLAGSCTSWCHSPELEANTKCCLHAQTRQAEGYLCLIFYF